ncbi:MAG: FG-GAP-like repeat-containing protein, partial [Acidobacteriota bacterium]
VLLGGGDGGPFLRFHRGNQYQIDSVARSATRLPDSLSRPVPFETAFTERRLSAEPEVSAVGDFDGDGIDDLVYASRHEPLLYLRRGSATGLHASEQRFELAGLPVLIVAGEFDRRDGRSDLAVTIEGRPDTVFLFPVIGVDRLPCHERIVAAEVGDFVWDRLHRSDVAVVVAPGLVRLLEFDLPGRGVAPSRLAPDRFAAQWTVRKSVGLARFVNENSRGHLQLTKGRLSTVPLDELVVWDENVPALQVVFGDPSRWRERQPAANLPSEALLNLPLNIPMDDPGVSVVALHLNDDAQHDLAVLHRDSGDVSMSVSAAATTFLVNSGGSEGDDDPSDGVCDTDKHVAGIVCTLNAAIEQANASPGMDTIEFSVSTVDIGDGVSRATDPLVIDGSGGGAGGRVELTRTAEGGGGPRIDAGGSVIRGLVINGAVDQASPPYYSGNSGISLDDNGGNRVENTYIGTNSSGSQA